MYENLMEEAVSPENYGKALRAVIANDGRARRDADGRVKRTSIEALAEDPCEADGGNLRAEPREAEIRKENGGGTRMLGIPTVLDRFIQQMLLQAMTPIWEPRFSEHSYGFRPGRKAADAVRAAQRYAETGKDWVVDLDIARFFDHVNWDIPMGEIGK
jgi:retron-type reverse transcriptase